MRHTLLAIAACLIATVGLAQEPSRPATTVQLPTFGVSIDADGLLSVREFAPSPVAAASPVNASRPAKADQGKLRKIGLRRLERALQAELDRGNGPTPEMAALAGLVRLEYLLLCPDKDGGSEIVLAGPSEMWIQDPTGRLVGQRSNRPVLLLEDLLVALRAFSPGSTERTWIGCTIDPPATGLVRLAEFQRTIPKAISQDQQAQAAREIGGGVEQALGLADVRVFGVSPRTHFARVLVEADYRMKRIAIGLEPPPVPMATVASSLTAPQPSMLNRFWFTPDPESVRVSEDRQTLQFVGHGVRLSTEAKTVDAEGRVVDAPGRSGRAGELYATAFTQKYSQIAAASPIYAQLRQMIDWTILAAMLRRGDWYGQAGWRAELLRDDARLPLAAHPVPQRAACLANAFWRGNLLLVPAGGGVTIVPDELVSHDALRIDRSGSLSRVREQTAKTLPADRWWWDE